MVKAKIFLMFFICFTILTRCSMAAEPVKSALSTEDQSSQMVYGWLKSLQLPNGLMESAEDSNFVSLYDNSLAAMVFSYKGDFERAEKIFDFFNNNLETEMKQSPGGFSQGRDTKGVPLKGKPHRWLGDNAWLLIALNNYHHLAGNNKYKELAASLEAWLRSLQDETDGGIWCGFDTEGKKIPKVTEGIIDAFNAVPGYDSFHEKILGFLEKEYWDPKTKDFLAWRENPKYKYALDLHSWGYCAFPDMPRIMLEHADRYRTTKIAAVNRENITGFDFDVDMENIWLEGTGEMVVAYRSGGMDFMVEYYLRELEKMIVLSKKNKDLGGLPYATSVASGYGGGSLWNRAEINPCISS